MSERKVSAIIPAAGLGLRMGSHKKQFLELEGVPIFVLTLRKFAACPEITEIFLAAPPGDIARMQNILAGEELGKSVTVAAGGINRQESVENCMRLVPPDTDLVAVHDAVRPFVSPEMISAVIHEAAQSGAAIPGILTVDTVKQVERNRILGTIPRERIILAQTPQVFRYEILKRAFEKAREDEFHGTDEASLVEHLGLQVTLVQGSDSNMKITKPADLELARFLLQQERDALRQAPLPEGKASAKPGLQ